MKPERRFAEVRAAGDGARILAGTVMPYGVVAVLPWGRERFDPGAFAGAAADGEVILNRQHDRGRPLVRAGAGLVLAELADAVTLRAELPAGVEQDQALADVRAGLLRGLSVEFVAEDERMAGDTRVVTRARLTGIGLVDRPQYDDATVEAMRAHYAGATAPARPRRVWVP